MYVLLSSHEPLNPETSRELKGAMEKTPTRIIGPPTTLINEDIFLPYHPSNEGERLKPTVLGVQAKPVDRPDRYERVK
ncbi:hypothetical protein AVEN_244786-1 [Araneus ventricosus]|uniref:Uncharacterized protein n=1 Tax=Araneus ventricosus TaxID=182803 RepID=A0A4Y2IFH0_ARAVE|nr:hypothetical protein AVEN_244786-1 [Araneus ventricosus]